MASGSRRKLAVILHADVVGSTLLVEKDETLAHERIQDGFRRFSKIIGAYGGTAHELRGDAIVAEFSRASDAVMAAIAFQAENKQFVAALEDEIQPWLRVGIAMGEVVIADNTVTGSGVVLAQRLEQLADSGGVCIQGAVHETVPKRLPFEYQSQGEKTLKGFEEPVRAYTVTLKEGEVIPASESVDRPIMATLEIPDKPSIAVLPFRNISGDSEQEYFSDGITEDIITALSKISHLFVIARNSSFTYKGRSVKTQQVAADLGVRHILDGSVRKAGNRVRVSVQLTDGATGATVWASRYDRELEDIFAVQDELTREIVNALRISLTTGEQQRIGHKGTDNVEAYDCYLRGREEVWHFGKGSLARARPFLDRAIELDPAFAAAYATMAIGHTLEFVNRWSESPEQSLERAQDFAQMAAKFDDSDPITYVVMSIIHRWKRQHDQAIREVEKAIDLDPNNAFAYSVYAITLHYAGKSDEALEKIETAMRLDPYYPDLWLHFLGQIYFMLERYEEAVDALQRRLLRNPATDISRVLLASCYGHLRQNDAAESEWSEVLRINPDYSLEYRRKILPYKNPADFERVAEGLAKAGLPH